MSLGYSSLVRYEYRYTTTSGSSTAWGAWTSVGTNRTATITGIPKGSKRYVELRAVTQAGPGTSTYFWVTPTK